MDSKLVEVLDDLHAVDVTAISDAVLLEDLDVLMIARNRLDAAISLRLGRAHSNETTISECGHGVKQFLVGTHHFGDRDAGRHVMVARALANRHLLREAFVAGDVSFEAVRKILSCLRQVPELIQPEAESLLVEAAKHLSVDDLDRVLNELRDAVGDDSAVAREQRKFDSRWLRLARTFGGMLHVEGMLDPESAETVQTAIDALVATRPADDERSLDQARADALTDLARQSQAHGDLPAHNGDRPVIGVTVDLDRLISATEREVRKLSPFDADFDQRLAELHDQVSRGELPPYLAILGSGVAAGWELTPEAAMRIACDALVIPAVVDGNGAVLELGRETRSWSRAQRRAAAIRDKGCTFTGCRAGLDRCELHHLDWWSRGGKTDIDNSAYLCSFHHWLIHHRNWAISRDKDTKQISVRRT